MKAYIIAILLLILAVIGWQQANSLSYQIAVKDATIDNLMVSLRQARNKPPEIRYIEVEKIIEVRTEITRFPNTPPYTAFPDPINFYQAMKLLYGMQQSHKEALNWTFESDPGFGIADKDLQLKFIRDYDQLIDYIWRLKSGDPLK